MRIFLFLSISLFTANRAFTETHSASRGREEAPVAVAPGTEGGVFFSNCSAEARAALKDSLPSYLKELGITPDWYQLENIGSGVNVSLTGNKGNTDTLGLCTDEKYKADPEIETYLSHSGRKVRIKVPSKKEIVLAMLQHGRTSEFENAFCSVEALKEHVAIRQNIVRWGKQAEWEYPETTPTLMNDFYWDEGWIVKPGKRAEDAVLDAFTGRYEYKMGCTKAGEIIASQGPIDYFMRHSEDPVKMKRFRELMADEPVNGTSKKYFTKTNGVPSNNWIPGDWGWIKNTDSKSSDIGGLEGSNIIYGGCGGFIGYYQTDPASRSLDYKVARVYRWRADRLEETVTDSLLGKLKEDPRNGGLLRDVREFPKNFFPELQPTPQVPTPFASVKPVDKPASPTVKTNEQKLAAAALTPSPKEVETQLKSLADAASADLQKYENIKNSMSKKIAPLATSTDTQVNSIYTRHSDNLHNLEGWMKQGNELIREISKAQWRTQQFPGEDHQQTLADLNHELETYQKSLEKFVAEESKLDDQLKALHTTRVIDSKQKTFTKDQVSAAWKNVASKDPSTIKSNMETLYSEFKKMDSVSQKIFKMHLDLWADSQDASIQTQATLLKQVLSSPEQVFQHERKILQEKVDSNLKSLEALEALIKAQPKTPAEALKQSALSTFHEAKEGANTLKTKLQTLDSSSSLKEYQDAVQKLDTSVIKYREINNQLRELAELAKKPAAQTPRTSATTKEVQDARDAAYSARTRALVIQGQLKNLDPWAPGMNSSASRSLDKQKTITVPNVDKLVSTTESLFKRTKDLQTNSSLSESEIKAELAEIQKLQAENTKLLEYQSDWLKKSFDYVAEYSNSSGSSNSGGNSNNSGTQYRHTDGVWRSYPQPGVGYYEEDTGRQVIPASSNRYSGSSSRYSGSSNSGSSYRSSSSGITTIRQGNATYKVGPKGSLPPGNGWYRVPVSSVPGYRD